MLPDAVDVREAGVGKFLLYSTLVLAFVPLAVVLAVDGLRKMYRRLRRRSFR